MFINEKYYNEDLISTMYFEIVEHHKEWLVYDTLEGKMLVSHVDNTYQSIDGKSGTERYITPKLLEHLEKEAEGYHWDNDDRDRAKRMLSRAKADLRKQDSFFNYEPLATYERNNGFIRLNIVMNNENSFSEDIMIWEFIQDYKDDEVYLKNHIKKAYSENISMEDIYCYLLNPAKTII